MEALLNSNYFPVVVFSAALILVTLVKNGKIKSIGLKGIEFEIDQKNFMQEIRNDIFESKADRKEMREILKASVLDRKEIHEELKKQSLADLRIQILLSATSYERKLALYDEYKLLGGNTWMDEWIADYIKLYKEAKA